MAQEKIKITLSSLNYLLNMCNATNSYKYYYNYTCKRISAACNDNEISTVPFKIFPLI